MSRFITLLFYCIDINNMFVVLYVFAPNCHTRTFLYRAKHVTKFGCSNLCERSNICMAFLFTPADGQCQLHATVFDLALYTGQTEPATDVLYYERGTIACYIKIELN